MAGALLQPPLLLLLSFALGSAAEAAYGNEERISSEVLCPIGAQPWQVALFVDYGSECAGVLIDRSWVLTIANCYERDYLVQIGGNYLGDPVAQMIRATEIYIHPWFDYPRKGHDIMLVKLSSPATLSSTVKTVDVPSSCKPDGTSCTVSGWGSGTTDKGERVFGDLMCTQTRILPRNECRNISLNTICALAPDRRNSTCKVPAIPLRNWHRLPPEQKDLNGDMGSPLMCEGSLQGLFSTGVYPCPPLFVPSSYTRVCRYHKWITDTMREHS